MRISLFLFVLVSFTSSCSVSNRIVEIDDPDKGIKSIKLLQNIETSSYEKSGDVLSPDYKLTSIYLYKEKKNDRPEITVDLRIIAPLYTDGIDSAVFFNLDNEKIGLSSNDIKYKQTVNDGYQLITRQFSIPENLWVTISNSQDIRLRLYIGKEGIDATLSSLETTRLKEFFIMAIQQLDAKFPAIPAGRKKW